MVKIKRLTRPSVSALLRVNELMSEMSLSKTPPKPITSRIFREMLGQRNVHLLAAVAEGDPKSRIIGIILVYFTRIPSGLTAMLEDLVVDEKYRKWGIGRLLVERGIAVAKEKRARHLSLRVNPKRIESNKLYQALGFHKMETNFYRLNLFK